jgi:hypothetical protein
MSTPIPVTLTGHLLRIWQSCKRRYFLEAQYRYLPYHPTNLFSACMRKAIFELSSGIPVEQVIQSASNQFISNVKYPGLDLPQGLNTYTIAMDLRATMATILQYLSGLTLLSLHHKAGVQVTQAGIEGLTWEFLAGEDESGVLHRWKFTDSLSDDDVLKELHSWEVFGDLVISGSPMTLHLINIGRREGSRRISPWCRAYKSPAINLYRFQKKSGNALEGSWKPIWFSDNIDNDPKVWVELMQNDNAIEPLVRHVDVREPAEPHVKNFYRHLKYELALIRLHLDHVKSDPFQLPITRPACDSPYVCPHQEVCYAVSPGKEIEGSVRYERKPTNPSPILT